MDTDASDEGCWWCWGMCAGDAETHASYQRKRYRNDTNYPTSTPPSQCLRRIGIPFYNCFSVTVHMFSGMNKLCAVYALGYALGRGVIWGVSGMRCAVCTGGTMRV